MLIYQFTEFVTIYVNAPDQAGDFAFTIQL